MKNEEYTIEQFLNTLIRIQKEITSVDRNLCFQVLNNLIISFIKLFPLFLGIAKPRLSSCQGKINLHRIGQFKMFTTTELTELSEETQGQWSLINLLQWF